MPATVTPEDLAREFCRVMHDTLSYLELQIAVLRNRAEHSADVCHTHDFCDANMVMAEAFCNLTGREPDIDDDAERATWNAAWKIARGLDFDVTNYPYQRRHG